MFFDGNFRASLFLVVVALVALSGCDSKVGEEPPPPISQEFAGARCLSQTAPVVKDFFKGAADSDEIVYSWNCVIGAVEKFKRYVRGRSADRYTSQELATFLEVNFLEQNSSGRKISPALQLEFMKLKQIFVGGDSGSISREEIDKLIVFFRALRTMTIKLNPYMKALTMNWSISEPRGLQGDIRYFEEANKELQNSARTLASMIEKNEASYKLSDFIALMENLDIFFAEKWKLPKDLAKYMPIVKKVKKALAGGDENFVTPTEWRRFTILGARGYIQFLRYYYFIKLVPETGMGYRLSYLSRTFEDLLSVFQDLTSEKPEGVVSRTEILDLLNTFQVIWPEFRVSNNLTLEIMKIKQLFFGGSIETISAKDFENARLKVSKLKTLAEKFLPYYLIYGGEWDPKIYDESEAQKIFSESRAILEITLKEAGMLFEGSYNLNDLVSLVREVEALYPPPSGQSWEEFTKKIVPLFIDAKNIALDSNDAILKKEQWSLLLGFAARSYSEYLYFNYFIKGNLATEVQTIQKYSVLMNQSVDILRDLLLVKKEKKFLLSELTKLTMHLQSFGFIPAEVKSESLERVLGLFLNNILVAPEQRIDGYKPEALTLSSVEVLRGEFQIWLDAEEYINYFTENWKPDEGQSAKYLIWAFSKALNEANASDSLKVALNEMILSIDSPVPMTFDENRRVLISLNQNSLYSAESLRKLNINRALSRILVRSFASSKERAIRYLGINLSEVQSAYAEVMPILVQTGLFTQKDTGFAASRFREANIFVPHSDGNELASFAELTDLIGMIWSGVNINSFLRGDLIRICFNGVDQAKEATVSLSCARRAYKEGMVSAMTSTPDYLRYMKNSSKDEWALYMNNIFKAAGYIPNDRNLVVLADIALAPHVIQYIEMVFAKFDKNKDGFISTPESIMAFPSFKGILLELTKEQIAKGSIKEKDLLDIFTFILRYGKPPESTSEKIRFVLFWKGKRDNWDVWADRGQMAQILGYIADQVNKGVKAMPNIMDGVANLESSTDLPGQSSKKHSPE